MGGQHQNRPQNVIRAFKATDGWWWIRTYVYVWSWKLNEWPTINKGFWWSEWFGSFDTKPLAFAAIGTFWWDGYVYKKKMEASSIFIGCVVEKVTEGIFICASTTPKIEKLSKKFSPRWYCSNCRWQLSKIEWFELNLNPVMVSFEELSWKQNLVIWRDQRIKSCP